MFLHSSVACTQEINPRQVPPQSHKIISEQVWRALIPTQSIRRRMFNRCESFAPHTFQECRREKSHSVRAPNPLHRRAFSARNINIGKQLDPYARACWRHESCAKRKNLSEINYWCVWARVKNASDPEGWYEGRQSIYTPHHHRTQLFFLLYGVSVGFASARSQKLESTFAHK